MNVKYINITYIHIYVRRNSREKFLSLGNTKRKLMGNGMNNVEEAQLTKNKRGRCIKSDVNATGIYIRIYMWCI